MLGHAAGHSDSRNRDVRGGMEPNQRTPYMGMGSKARLVPCRFRHAPPAHLGADKAGFSVAGLNCSGQNRPRLAQSRDLKNFFLAEDVAIGGEFWCV